MLKFTLLIYLAPFLVTATAIAEEPTSHDLPSVLTVVASRPGSPIDGLTWEAGGLRFQLGGQPLTFCPVENCPPGVDTAIAGLSSMVSQSLHSLFFKSIQ
jgi:hypothetical protein